MEQLLETLDKLDVDGVSTLFAPHARILTADGRRAEGSDAVRQLMSSFLSELRSTSHRVTAEWHSHDVWIAEVEASYELRDYLRMDSLPRIFVVRTSSEGIVEMRVYGAHERPLSDHPTGEEGMWIGGRWVPPL